MKINSKFANKCPGCGKAIVGQEGKGWSWPCSYCPAPICEWCYHEHTAVQHGEKYGPQ